MTVDISMLELLPERLKHEIIEDISRRGDKQSVIARKQRMAIKILAAEAKKHQGARSDLRGDTRPAFSKFESYQAALSSL
jgi:hypothetical protein